MRKEYMKPQTVVNEIAMDDCLMNQTSVIMGGKANSSDAEGKYRDELWVEDVDLWGNESWTRVE